MPSRLAFLPCLLLAAACLPPAGAEEPAPRFEVREELKGHEGRVRTLAFGPDGRLLASGGLDRTLRLWRVDTGEAVAKHTLPRGG